VGGGGGGGVFGGVFFCGLCMWGWGGVGGGGGVGVGCVGWGWVGCVCGGFLTRPNEKRGRPANDMGGEKRSKKDKGMRTKRKRESHR